MRVHPRYMLYGAYSFVVLSAVSIIVAQVAVKIREAAFEEFASNARAVSGVYLAQNGTCAELNRQGRLMMKIPSDLGRTITAYVGEKEYCENVQEKPEFPGHWNVWSEGRPLGRFHGDALSSIRAGMKAQENPNLVP